MPFPFDPAPATLWTLTLDDRFASCEVRFVPIGVEARILWNGRLLHARTFPNGDDWLLGNPLEWAIEIKMSRPNGDNGKPDDTAIKDILSPYSADRSALTDCVKLADADLPCRRAILIYGFDDPRRPLVEVIEAFETLARSRVLERK